MTDITNLFRATVKTVKTRQRAQGVTLAPDKSILAQKHKSDFSVKTKKLVAEISKLRDFLLEHRKDYLSVGSCLIRERSHMTDAERDQIDTEAQTVLRLTADAIKNIRTEVHNNRVLVQVREHREGVVQLLDQYLKLVCSLFSEQRAVRVKRVVDRKRLSRLEVPVKKRKGENSETLITKSEENTGQEKNDKKENGPSKSQSLPTVVHQPTEEDELSPEEIQMFQVENQQMFDEMNSLMDEVKQIEGKVIEISRLQEIFSDKVLQQEKDIDRVADVVVGTTENIKEANEDIREAMKNNAGLRVWILFFLIVCSLSLLFLDWYNA